MPFGRTGNVGLQLLQFTGSLALTLELVVRLKWTEHNRSARAFTNRSHHSTSCDCIKREKKWVGQACSARPRPKSAFVPARKMSLQRRLEGACVLLSSSRYLFRQSTSLNASWYRASPSAFFAAKLLQRGNCVLHLLDEHCCGLELLSHTSTINSCASLWICRQASVAGASPTCFS